jgi:hypothetical protein
MDGGGISWDFNDREIEHFVISVRFLNPCHFLFNQDG